MNLGIAVKAAAAVMTLIAPAAAGATPVEMLKGVKLSVLAYEGGKLVATTTPSGEQDIENMRQQVEKTLKEVGLDFSFAEGCAAAASDVVLIIGLEPAVGGFGGGVLVMRKSDKKELLRKDWFGEMDARLDISTPLPPEQMAKVRATLTRRFMLADFYTKLKTGLSTGKWGKGNVSKRLPKCL